MKKIYLTPETIETKIELQKMIAGSAPQLITDPDEEADEKGDVLSRRRNRNAWEDEEDDDEEDF
jgi:hypothetical protein